MTFTFDLGGNVGKVRNMIGDTVSASAHFTDEQLNAFISQASNDLFLAAAMALRAWAAYLARTATAESAGDYSRNTKGQAESMLAAAEALETASNNTPAEAVSDTFYEQFGYERIQRDRILREEPLE